MADYIENIFGEEWQRHWQWSGSKLLLGARNKNWQGDTLKKWGEDGGPKCHRTNNTRTVQAVGWEGWGWKAGRSIGGSTERIQDMWAEVGTLTQALSIFRIIF